MPPSSFQSKVLSAFAAALLVVAALCITTWKLANDASEAADWVAHTHQVLGDLSSVRGNTLQIELNTQGFRVSGDSRHLDERELAMSSRETAMQHLQQLVADHPDQLRRWLQLREVIDQRIALSRQIELLRKTQGMAAATDFVNKAPLKETRERVRTLLRDMDVEERRLLNERSAAQRQAHQVWMWIGSLAAGSLLALLAVNYGVIRRQLRETATSRRIINEQNQDLERRVLERTAELRESQDHLRSIVANVPALIAYVNADQRYVYVNQQYHDRFAPHRESIAGCSVLEILGEERYAIAEPLITKVLQGQHQSYDWQPFPDVWQVINYVPKFDAGHRVQGYYVMGVDITERKHAEERIRSLNAELGQRVHDLEHVSRGLRTLSAGNRTMLRSTDETTLLQGMCEAIVGAGGYDVAVVWYCNNDADKTLRAVAEHGYAEGLEALDRLNISWADTPHGQGAVGTAIRTGVSTAIRDMGSDPRYAPWTSAQLQGRASALACPLRVHGEIIGALAIYDTEPGTFEQDELTLLTESADDLAFGIATLRARAEQEENQRAITRLTHFDPLTGLPNEVRFSEHLDAAIESAGKGRGSFFALQCNIERLTEINDALGFSQGDKMLCEFGRRLRAAAPESAVVARLRGDEFAVLLNDGDIDRLTATLQGLEAALSAPFAAADIPLDLSATTGVVLYPEHGRTPHDLFRHMDIAVHQAQRKGLQHAIFDPTLNQSQPGQLNMAGELRQAIVNGDLRIYLQPKVEFASGRTCGAEALVRWQHAERGLIPPGEFITLAENTGLIKPLTEWVIDAVLRLNHQWQEQGRALPIAVNLSARNLRDEELLNRIRRQQHSLGLRAGLLELEITESTVMEDADFSLRALNLLRDEGIPLYIDDFGTGYSSLSYLQKLPVDYIKIDQSFVRGMSFSKDSAVIVRSTIDLVHDLGRKTVAEGVETQAHWDQLAALGCDIAQGYFIAKPMPAAEFQVWADGFRAPASAAAASSA